MNRPFACLLLPLLTLAGCATMEPHYARPNDAVPQALPTGPAYPAAGTAQPWASLGWSDFFADPRLKQVIGLALDNNRDLRIAIANIAEARSQYRIQRSALVPQISGQGSATYGSSSADATTIPGEPAEHFNERDYALNVASASYELDLWGRVRSLNKEALEQYLSTQEARRSTQISLVSETATAWLTLAGDQSTLAVAQETFKSAQASFELAQRRFGKGITSELDLRQAQTLAQQAHSRITELTTSVAQDTNALQLLVGAPVAPGLLPAALDATVTNREELPANLDSTVLLTRPDVLSAEHKLRAANFDIGAARAAFFPTISLTASAGVSSTQLGNLFTSGATTWSFVPSISLPLLDGGKRRAQLDQSRADKTIQVATYEKAVQTAFREVADALARRGTIDEEIAADTVVVAAASRSLQLSARRYGSGIDTYLDVLDAQRTLFTAQQNLITARVARADNLVTLFQVLGGGLTS